MKIEITASPRHLEGTAASRRLRLKERVPGILYGGPTPPQSLEFEHNPLWHAMRKEAFHASILSLRIDGKEQPVLLRSYKMHPFRPQIQHIDFQRVEANRPVHIRVPLHFINADISPAVKLGHALISHVINELDIACLPSHLPEFISIDLKDLNAGSSLHVKDIALPEGVRAVLRGKANPVVVTALAPLVEEETTAAAPVVSEVPATAQKKPVEAAAPAGDKKDKDGKKKK